MNLSHQIIRPPYLRAIPKEQLLLTLRQMLETDQNLEFLNKLDDSELQRLVAAVRYRLGRFV